MPNRDSILNIFSDKIRVMYDKIHNLVQVTVYSTARLANNTAVDTLIANFTITKDLLEEAGILLDEERFHMLTPETKVEKKKDKMDGMVS